MRKTLIAATGLAFTLTAGPALASPDGLRGVTTPRSEWMSVAQIALLIESQGHVVREIEAEDGLYEVKTTAADGRRMELYVNPVTGAVVRESIDN